MTLVLDLAAPRTVRQVRDVSLWSDGDTVYVVACDANAGVGSRSADFLQRRPEDAGYSAAKVALMEVYAAGARPLLVVNTLCLPFADDYGRRIVDGIRQAMAEGGSSAPLTGSDETNMTTTQTGLGVTVIGTARGDQLMIGAAQAGDVVLCAGYPRSGLPDAPYVEGGDDVASVRDVVDVASAGVAHELLPVGSKGVLAELRQLADTAGLSYTLTEPTAMPLDVSAGASTCFLAACPPDQVAELAAATRLTLTTVAMLESAH